MMCMIVSEGLSCSRAIMTSQPWCAWEWARGCHVLVPLWRHNHHVHDSERGSVMFSCHYDVTTIMCMIVSEGLSCSRAIMTSQPSCAWEWARVSHVLVPLHLCCFVKKKVRVCFYIAHNPVSTTAQSALHFTPWQTCSFWHQLDFSGKHYSRAAIMCNDYSLIFPTPSLTRYSFVQLSQLGSQWRERKCPNFETVAKEDSNLGSLDCESVILPCSSKEGDVCYRVWGPMWGQQPLPTPVWGHRGGRRV